MTERKVWGTLGGLAGLLLLMGFLAPPGSDHDVTAVHAAAFDRAPQQVFHTATADVFTCADGLSIPAGIEVKGQKFTAVGELVSGHENDFTVRAFPAQIFATLTPDAATSGSFLPGDMVRTSGFISDGRFFATSLSPSCGAPPMVTEVTGTPAPSPIAVTTDAPAVTAAPAIVPAVVVQPEPVREADDSADDDRDDDSDEDSDDVESDKPDKPDKDDGDEDDD